MSFRFSIASMMAATLIIALRIVPPGQRKPSRLNHNRSLTLGRRRGEEVKRVD